MADPGKATLDEAGYEQQWRWLRRRRVIIVCLGLGLLPWFGIVTAVEGRLGVGLDSSLGFLPVDAYFIGWVAFIIFSSTKCPRCGRSFYRTSFERNPFTRRCLNCALPWGARRAAGDDRFSDRDTGDG